MTRPVLVAGSRHVVSRLSPRAVPALAGLLARRPELRGVGISSVLEAVWAS